MIFLKSCPVCDSKDISQDRLIPSHPLTFEIIQGVKVDAAIISNFNLCQNCRLIFQNPRLSDEDLDRFYNQGHYRRIFSSYFTIEQMDSRELDRAKLDAKIIKNRIGKVDSHLDIGCGRGFLLNEVGAKVRIGVDSDTDYVKDNGIVVFKEISQVLNQKFDLVTCTHVLEHVSKPLEYLKSITKFVKKDGYMFIEVPSKDTPGGPIGFVHLHYFEPEVLKSMCSQAGLKVIHEEFTPHLFLICQKVI